MTLMQSDCMSSRLLRLPGRVISVKLHPQKVLGAHGHAIQWNLSNVVTWGPNIFGLIREVHGCNTDDLSKAVM